MIRQVVYLSSARAGTGDAEIAAILDAARAANGRNGLTGMLAVVELTCRSSKARPKPWNCC